MSYYIEVFALDRESLNSSLNGFTAWGNVTIPSVEQKPESC